MSEAFRARREVVGIRRTEVDTLEASVWMGDLVLTSSENDKPEVSVIVRAADARRLLAWLRERYPDTDTGEPR